MDGKVELIEPNENYIQRWKFNNIEFGFTQMLFGVRFRAGYIGEDIVSYDWCCGTSEINKYFAFNVFNDNIKRCETIEELFAKFPICSNIKPFDSDIAFVEKLLK